MDETMTVQNLMDVLEGFPSEWEVEFVDQDGQPYVFDMAHNPTGVCRIVIKKIE